MLHPRRQALGAIVLSAEPDGRKIERLEVPKATDQLPVFVPKIMLETPNLLGGSNTPDGQNLGGRVRIDQPPVFVPKFMLETAK